MYYSNEKDDEEEEEEEEKTIHFILHFLPYTIISNLFYNFYMSVLLYFSYACE
jgi:hypothetical protein